MAHLARHLMPLVASLAMAAPAVAAPALWEVRDEDSTIWLFGSFHILPEGTAWRTQLFEQTLAGADKVVFEANIGPAAISEMGAKAFASGIYVDGTVLTDVIDDDAEARLRALASDINLPFGSMLAMKPWFAANTISVGAMAAAGYSAEGVESILQPELDASRQVFLETLDEQLDVLSGAPESDQIAMLEATLNEIDTLPKVLDKMLSHWIGGTTDQLASLFLNESVGYQEAFLERLIFQRNRNWMAPIEAMLAENQQSLVVVGAAHLIGDSSVIHLLEQAGYQVARIQ